MAARLHDRTLAALGWADLLALVARQAQSLPGVAAVAALDPWRPTRHAATRAARVGAVMTLHERAETLPGLAGLHDVGSILATAERDGMLESAQLWAVRDAARCVAAVVEWRETQAPDSALQAFVAALPSEGALARAIEAIFESDGTIKDSASWDLHELRSRLRSHQKEVTAVLDALVAQYDTEGLLSDTFVTVRSGRYVIPVKSEQRGRVEGILHDVSHSGHSVFMEPAPVVEAGNRMVALAAQIAQEERRILGQISAEVKARAASLREAVERLTELDVDAAAARFFGRLGGSLARVATDDTIELLRLRHPLLQDERGEATVANDVRLELAQRAVIVSGPNAGGKTVLLRALGLAVLCHRTGLPVTAAPGSSLPVIESVLVSIGDAQNIAAGLSTFSGHVAELAAFLAAVRVEPRALVLLDELAADTEPVQGAALARAVVEAFVDAGTRVLVSTHYTNLKLMAHERDGFVNAAMGFDEERGLPTFRVHLGDTGSSNPLAVARAAGLPETVIARARALAGPEHERVEGALATLQQRLARVESERAELAQLRDHVQAERHALALERNKIARQARQVEERVRTEWETDVRTARTTLHRVIAELQQQTGTPKERMRRAQAAQAAVTAVEARQAGLATVAPPLAPAALQPGTRVRVADMGEALFTVEAVDERRGTVEVRRDRLRAHVPLARVQLTAGGQAPAAPVARRGARTLRSALLADDVNEPVARAERAGTRLDLRGMRVDDAVRSVELFLDAHYDDGLDVLVVVHGHGTGALKEAVRSNLASSPYVADWRRGELEEGGDGVTVVTLK